MSDEAWSDSSDSDSWEESKQPLQRRLSYELLNEAVVREKEASSVWQVVDSTGISDCQAELLLSKYEWNVRAVCQRVFDGRGVDEVLNGVLVKATRVSMCGMCYCKYPPEKMKGHTCRHFYCNDCYGEYLTLRIAESGLACLSTRCPTSGCTTIVSGELFKALLPQPVYADYRKLLLRSYIESRPGTKYCPAANCSYSVDYPKTQPRSIVCDCGFVWCFQCKSEGHSPITCEQMNEWEGKFGKSNDISDKTWIELYTKPCPKCRKTIEKNAGCMHMTCTCRHEFCWLCLGDWLTHTSSSGTAPCNVFHKQLKEGNLSKDQQKRVIGLLKMNQANHYTNRFDEHKRAVNFAQEKLKRQRIEAENIIRVIPGVNSRELDFVMEALRLVIEARSVVAYSYPYGFFMTDAHKLPYYEFIQGELEHSLDGLDEKTEQPLLQFVTDITGSMSLKPEFYLYRSEVISLTDIVRGHLHECTKQMEAGFPDIKLRRTEAEINSDFSKSSTTWTCTYCIQQNPVGTEKCGFCNYRNRLLDPDNPLPEKEPKAIAPREATARRPMRGRGIRRKK